MGHPSRPLRLLIAVGLAVVGLALVWVAYAGPSTPGTTTISPDAAPSTPERSPAPRAQPDVRDQIEGEVLPESEPVSLSIARIDVDTSLVKLGIDGKGEMEVPQDAGRAGWFTRAATPGALGPAVIAGHVTWQRTSGVFYRLGTLRRGDEVTVTRKDGITAVFTVTRVDRFAKSRFPTRDVYGAIDHAGLRLVTCAGRYDAARRTYPDNVVVFAKLSGVRRSRG